MKFKYEGRPLKFIGGRTCLDFVNTKNWDSHEAGYERFQGYADLVFWNHAAGQVSDSLAERLFLAAAERPEAAAAILARGVALRSLLYDTFAAIAAGQPLAAIDIAPLNEAIAEMMARSRLMPDESGFAWVWAGEETALERVLWPPLHSAALALTSDELERVKRCAGYSCGWLFLDTSRNGRRRWCEMAHCGNRAKARRYYRRHQGEE